MMIEMKVRKCAVCNKIRSTLKIYSSNKTISASTCDECINALGGLDKYIELVEAYNAAVVH